MVRQDIVSILFAITVAVASPAQAGARPEAPQSDATQVAAVGKDISVEADNFESLIVAIQAVGKDIS